MKTIYKDRMEALLWIYLFLVAWFLFHAVGEPISWRAAVNVIFAIGLLWAASVEFKRRRNARLKGEEPPIVKVVD